MKSLKTLFCIAGIVFLLSRGTVNCVEPREFWNDDDDDDINSNEINEDDVTTLEDLTDEGEDNPDGVGWWDWLANNEQQNKDTETSTNKLPTTTHSKITVTTPSVISDHTNTSDNSSTVHGSLLDEPIDDKSNIKKENGTDENSKSDSSSESFSSELSDDSSSNSSDHSDESKSESSLESISSESSDDSSSSSSDHSDESKSESSSESSSKESEESKEEEFNDKETTDKEEDNDDIKIAAESKIHKTNDENKNGENENDNSNIASDSNMNSGGEVEKVGDTSVKEGQEKETWTEWFKNLFGNNDNDDEPSDNDSFGDNSEFSHDQVEDMKDDDINTDKSYDSENVNGESTTIKYTTPQTEYPTSTRYQKSTEISIEDHSSTVNTNFQTTPNVTPRYDQLNHIDNGPDVVHEQAPDLNAAVLGNEEQTIDDTVNTSQNTSDYTIPNPFFQVPTPDEHNEHISCKDKPMVVKEICEIPNIIVEKYNKDLTTDDIHDYIFHPSKVEALIKDCHPGEWCMEDGIPLTQMNLDAIYGLCPIRQCLANINETCLTKERLLTRQSLDLLCDLHTMETASNNMSNCCDKCLVNLVIALHVQMADIMRQGLDGVEQDVCLESDFYFMDTLCYRESCSNTMGRLMCLYQECPDFLQQFKTFQKWGAFFANLDRISDKCTLGNATCFNNSLEVSMKGQGGMMDKFKTIFWENGNWKTLSGVCALLGISLIGVICVVFMYMRRHKRHPYDRQDIEYSEVKSYDRL